MDVGKYEQKVQNYIETIQKNRMINPEVTLESCTKLIEYAGRSQDEVLLGYGYYYCAEVYYCLNDGEHFYDTLNQALRFLDRGHEYELIARAYNFLGIKASNGGNIPLALEYYSTGQKYAARYHLDEVSALLEVNLGGLLYRTERYQEALIYYKRAVQYFSTLPDEIARHMYLAAVECNEIKTLVALGYFDMAEDVLHEIKTVHWKYLGEQDKNVVYLVEAILYYEEGNLEQRDEVIHRASKMISGNMAILDFFDDYYDYAKMLLQTDLADDFWKVVDLIERLTKNAGSTDLMLKIISLKIQFYRKYNQSADYLRAAGLYYELSVRMEEETKVVVNNVINLRQSLDAANELRVQIENENRMLVEKSELDALTKIANRYRLNDYSEEAYIAAFNNGYPLAVCIMDVDYFKEYNDNYGHQQGDECLIAVAETMSKISASHNGFCARYGGDEFVIIYENVSIEDAVSYAAELKKEILGMHIEHRFSRAIPQITLSQGLCWAIPKKGVRMWDFLHKADENLYEIKQISRNSFLATDLQGENRHTGGKE